MKLTYYGHACFSVEIAGKHLLFDPYIRPNELAKHIDVSKLKADYILLSHGHGDHIADCIEIAGNNNSLVIAAYEIAEWLHQQGVEKTQPMNIGGTKTLKCGKVKCVNAIHSSVLPDGTYAANPMGFLVHGAEKNFYYSGDTALTMDMQLIPKWAKLDFAVLCIGGNFTMDYEDAIEAARMIDCNQIVGVHYDTFGYIKIDHEKTKKAFADAGLTLYLPAIGETIDL